MGTGGLTVDWWRWVPLPSIRFSSKMTHAAISSARCITIGTDGGVRHSTIMDLPYEITPDHRQCFQRDGYVHLPGFLDETTLGEVEEVYSRFVRGEIPVLGRDLCDMSGGYGTDPSEFAIVNVMLPRRYHPAWQHNGFERRAAQAAEALIGPHLTLDYDQLLAKPPGRPNGVFPWHQDLAYWFDTPDPRTATFWLALDDSREDNGCLRFVPGSHRESQLRPHRPLLGDRGEAHALVAEVRPTDPVSCAVIRRGDCTVHHERVLHGSGPNTSARWRRAYIVAFRAASTVQAERAIGFTHSHNDPPEVLNRVEAMRSARGSGTPTPP